MVAAPTMVASTIILSDLHLGRTTRAAVSPESIAALCEPFDRVVLNGDVYEAHHPALKERGAEAWRTLKDKLMAAGCEFIPIAGNHDAKAFDRRDLFLEEGLVWVTHGDVLDERIAPWSLSSKRMAQAWEKAASQMPIHRRVSREGQLEIARLAGFAEWDLGPKDRVPPAGGTSLRKAMRDPGRLISVLRYWKECPDRALRFANTTGVQAPILVLGHSHNAGRWRRENRTILNTGAFGFPGSPYAVVLDDRGVALQAVERTDQGYQLAEKPYWFDAWDAIRAQASSD
ncbi:MAG: hypothetical protein VYA02_07555 [Planctomycetota bacterium]|nr:hypothetical protein [Planctomycetota bacterium]